MNTITETETETLVLGAGIAGMGASWQLKKQGEEFLILEASGQCGGVLQSKNINGFELDMGANTAAQSLEYLEFLEYLGVKDRLLFPEAVAGKRLLWLNDQLTEVSNSIPGILGMRGLSTKAKLRLFLEPFVKPGTTEDESIRSFLSRRLGSEITDKIADAVMTGIYAGDIKLLSAKAIMGKLKEGEQEYGSLFGYLRKNKPASGGKRIISSLSGGFSTVATAFEQKFSDLLKLGRRVNKISVKNGYWLVDVNIGETKEAYRCKNLLCTIPAYSAAKILKEVAPDTALHLASIRYNPMGMLHIGIRKEHTTALPNAFGFLVPSGEKKAFLGALFNSKVFTGKAPETHHLLTVFHQNPNLTAEEAYSLISKDFSRAFGITAPPDFLHQHYWEKAIPQFEIGFMDNLAAVRDVNKLGNIRLAGNYMGKVSVSDTLNSGVQAARELSQA